VTRGGLPKEPTDDGVVYLDEDGSPEDVARALAEAARAVEAVEERHRGVAPSGEAETVAEAPGPRSREQAMEHLLATEHERASQAEDEAGQLRETLQRKVADFENLKKRTERDKNDYLRFALTEVMRDILGVLDNLERALHHNANGAPPADFGAGIEMIVRQLTELLRRYGVMEVPALGTPFDPNVHEAVMLEETTSAPPGTVVEVFQKGYTLNERLLRPTMVKVSAAPSADSEAEG
jgi:molecular chaperone GrpE